MLHAVSASAHTFSSISTGHSYRVPGMVASAQVVFTSPWLMSNPQCTEQNCCKYVRATVAVGALGASSSTAAVEDMPKD